MQLGVAVLGIFYFQIQREGKMEKIKKCWTGVKCVVKGIFDTDVTKKVTGCCGGYVSELGCAKKTKSDKDLNSKEEQK
jgi:hypothetical protein